MPQNPEPAADIRVTPKILLQNSNYLKLWLNGGTATTMRWLELLAIGFFVQKTTDSEFLVGMMFFLRWIPMVLLGSFVGALAERLDRRKIFICSIATLWLVSLTLAILAFMDSLEIWHIAVGTTINGCLNVIEFPVRRTLIGDVVETKQLMSAMALDSVTNQCTRMAGPFLGVIIEGYVGIIGVYFLGVIMHTIGIYLIFTLRLIPRPTRTDKVRVFSEIADGFRHIKTREMLVATLAVTAIMNFFAMSFSSQIPAIAVEVLKLGTEDSGYLAAAEGFGAFVGAMVIATRQFTTPGRLFLFGSILFELGILAFSHTPVLGIAVALLIIGGAGHSGFSASQSALMISRADPAMRSRAMGAIAVCIGTQPFGILLLAAVAESYGAPFAIAMNAVLGILLLIYAGWKWPVLLRRED